MNALLWKKIIEIKNQKAKTVVMFAFPFLIGLILIVKQVQGIELAFSMPLFNIIVCWLFIFNIEDFVYAEVVFGTGISIWKIWNFNMIFVMAMSVFYTIVEVLLLVGFGIKNGRIDMIHLIISFCCGYGLLCFATCYISDYSKIRNYISSVGGIINLVILGYICVTFGKASLLVQYRNILLGGSCILALVSIVIVYKFSKIEKFVNNVKQLSDGYDAKVYIDE